MSKEFGEKEVEAVTEIAKTLPEKKTKFYVGQLVENKRNGKGNVENINKLDRICPIIVLFENGMRSTFTLKGQYLNTIESDNFDIKPVEIEAVDKSISLEDELEQDWPGVFETVCELATESDSDEFDGHSFSVDSRTIDGFVNSADCYLSNGDTFEFESNNSVGSRVNSYEKSEQPMISNDIKPPKVFNDAIFHIDWSKETIEERERIRNVYKKIVNRVSNNRMIANDTNPTPLAMKPVPEKTELTAKCALCGEPCKPRNGEKFYSICGGCK